jgi:hypothetical protein
MAKGSHATFGAYDARICCICGQPIRITKHDAWFHHDNQTGEHRSTHTRCGSPLQVAAPGPRQSAGLRAPAPAHGRGVRGEQPPPVQDSRKPSLPGAAGGS